jgi:hypothetical protein
MPSKRTPITHRQIPDISPVALFHATDGFWGERPVGPVSIDEFDFGYPTVKHEKCRDLWLTVRDELLPYWVNERAGTRPSWWYLFDPECPRVSADDIQRLHWQGWYFLEITPDLRRRVGGQGTPDFERYSVGPCLRCAVPTNFIDLNEADPPRYESEAAYLDRHGLLAAAEKARLTSEHFEPDVLEVEE